MKRILIVGGSTRAAADSVRRAGWQPVCADLFADLDLRKNANVIPVRKYPESLPDDVANVRADGWFYCGALENHPNVLQKMLSPGASYGTLLGTPPEVLKFVRDPFWLESLLRRAGLKTLDVASENLPPIPDGTWLQKPLASAGGRSIRVWESATCSIPFGEPHYFQRRVCGIGLSAIFRVQNRVIEWLGASHELDARDSSSSPTPFSYCGSVGPLKLFSVDPERTAATAQRFRVSSAIEPARHNSDEIRVFGSAVYHAGIQRQLTKTAKALVRNVPGLLGLIGLDFRLNEDNIYLTEVNPRYTASVEILELACGRSFLNPEVFYVEDANRLIGPSRPKIIAKQILYAATAQFVGNLSERVAIGNPWQIPAIADVPMPGTVIEAGWPICTVMAAGNSLKAVKLALLDQITLTKQILFYG